LPRGGLDSLQNDPVTARADAIEDAVIRAAEVLISVFERDAGVRLELAAVGVVGSVGVAFFCQREPKQSAEPEAVIVLVDEESPGQWEALGASSARLGGSGHVSIQPSERGDWIVAVMGSAPPDARVAVVEFRDVEHRVPVEAGFYAFVERAPAEPKHPPTTKPRFE
jgi:hypothetical protein